MTAKTLTKGAYNRLKKSNFYVYANFDVLTTCNEIKLV